MASWFLDFCSEISLYTAKTKCTVNALSLVFQSFLNHAHIIKHLNKYGIAISGLSGVVYGFQLCLKFILNSYVSGSFYFFSTVIGNIPSNHPRSLVECMIVLFENSFHDETRNNKSRNDLLLFKIRQAENLTHWSWTQILPLTVHLSFDRKIICILHTITICFLETKTTPRKELRNRPLLAPVNPFCRRLFARSQLIMH